MTESSSRFIPNYITARSLPGLRRLMLTNNSRKGYFYKYFDIQFVNEGSKQYWVAFYFDEVKLDNIDQITKELSEDGE